MEKIKSNLLGVIALVLVIIAAIFAFNANSFGIWLAAASFILAVIDIVIGFKKETLAFQEYFQVAVKEKTFSVIAIFGCVIIAFFIPEIIAASELAKFR